MTPDQEHLYDSGQVALVAVAPDGTKLWAVRGQRTIYFASSGTQTAHSEVCGKGCVRSVVDMVPTAPQSPQDTPEPSTGEPTP